MSFLWLFYTKPVPKSTVHVHRKILRRSQPNFRDFKIDSVSSICESLGTIGQISFEIHTKTFWGPGGTAGGPGGQRWGPEGTEFWSSDG